MFPFERSKATLVQTRPPPNPPASKLTPITTHPRPSPSASKPTCTHTNPCPTPPVSRPTNVQTHPHPHPPAFIPIRVQTHRRPSAIKVNFRPGKRRQAVQSPMISVCLLRCSWQERNVKPLKRSRFPVETWHFSFPRISIFTGLITSLSLK